MAKSRLPPKKDVALALLENSTVYVHLDPRANGVSVPPWFKKQPQLVLQVGLNMPVPIPDLSLDGNGMSCTLSFNRTPQFCNVPWSAIYALVGEDGRGMVWPDDVPPEVAAQTRSGASQEKPKRKKKAQHLRALAKDASEDPPPASRAAVSGSKTEQKSAATADPPTLVKDVEESADPDAAPDTAGPEESGEESTPPSKRKLPPYLRVVK